MTYNQDANTNFTQKRTSMSSQDDPLRGADARSAPVATLCAMFDHAVATAPDKVALRHSGVALTYREVGRAVAALARRLAPIVTPGEVVALVLPNSIQFHIAYFAALKALAAPALLNPLYRRPNSRRYFGRRAHAP